MAQQRASSLFGVGDQIWVVDKLCGAYVTRLGQWSPIPWITGQNQKWPTSGRGTYVNPIVRSLTNAFGGENKAQNGPQVGRVAT